MPCWAALGGELLDDPHDHEQDYRPDKCHDDRAENAAAKGQGDTEDGKEPIGDQGAEYAHDDVANQSKPVPWTKRLASQPATPPTTKVMMSAVSIVFPPILMF